MPQPKAEIFSQGDEVITGEITDTNAAWLGRELWLLGFDVTRHHAVGDRLEALVDVMREIAERADLCLCTGGLGPTCDDLTAEAVGRAFGLPLQSDPAALAQIEAYFTRSGRSMPEPNKKQALLPQGSQRLDNLWGTAPGFMVSAGRCRFVFMPGVPSEMKAMFEHWVRPELVSSFELKPMPMAVLRTVGVGESALQERLDRIALPPEVRLGFRAGGSENRVKLLFPPDFPEAERKATIRRAVEAMGDAVYAVGDSGDADSDLASVVGTALTTLGANLYTIETLSGGRLAERCAGADWFLGGAVVPDTITLCLWYGCESFDDPAKTASRVAKHARKSTDADYVLVQFAPNGGGDGGTDTASVEVHFALANRNRVLTEQQRIGGGPRRQRTMAAALALDFLRRYLIENGEKA